MIALACQKCGAGLPAPDQHGNAQCVYCGMAHRDHSRAQLAEDAARIPLTDDSVLALLKQHFAGADSMYLRPTIPTKKEINARNVHAAHLPTSEYILALYDDTVFGSAEDGFVITSRRVCWKNISARPHMIEWANVDPDRLWCEDRKLYIGAGAIEVSGDPSVIDACADAFHVLAFSARPSMQHAHAESGIAPVSTRSLSEPPPSTDFKPTPMVATPPPMHHVSYQAYAVHSAMQPAPSFACWHCKTPLHWNTPQCAYCGAWPSAEGWLRTA
jgi:hypothetical protein